MDERPIIIIGAGGHARVLLDILLEQKRAVVGLTDTESSLWGTTVFGVPVLGDDSCLMNYPAEQFQLVNGIGSVGSMRLHQKVYEMGKQRKYLFANVIHASVTISSRVTVGEGTVIMPGVVVNEGTVLGVNDIINTRAVLDHECRIGNHVHIAPGCVLSGSVQIEDAVHIGTGSTIIQGICIGHHALIGAGTVVVKNIEANQKVYGVPARVVGEI